MKKLLSIAIGLSIIISYAVPVNAQSRAGAFLQVLNEAVEQYGEYQEHKKIGNYKTTTGVVYVNEVDFDNDGISELLFCTGEVNDESQEPPYIYKYHIYRYVDGAAMQLFKGKMDCCDETGYYDGTLWAISLLYGIDGKVTIYSHRNGDGHFEKLEDGVWNIYDNLIYSTPPLYESSSEYFINGEKVSYEEYRVYWDVLQGNGRTDIDGKDFNGSYVEEYGQSFSDSNYWYEQRKMREEAEAVDNAENVTVELNGSQISFDQPPIIRDGRTLVPMRAIFEAMGCEVEWNGDAQTIVAYKNGNAVMGLMIGDNYMWTPDDPRIYMDVPPQIVNNRTLVPVRAISESMGAEVNWDGDSRTVRITYYENHDSEAKNALREYARNNLLILYNNEDSGHTYDNVKYLFADMSGDDIPELIAVGIYDNITVSYIEIYQYSDNNVERIVKGHCEPYHGGAYYPVMMYGNTYLCSYAPSSIHGYSRMLMQYNGEKWEDIYNSRVTYDRIKGEINGYIVNNESASEEEYNNFNALIESGTLKVDDFVYIESL